MKDEIHSGISRLPPLTPGNSVNTLALSAALAFAKARSKMPDPKLYRPDQRRLSVAETYPSALPIYAGIYKKSPVGSTLPMGIEAESGKMLKEVRWGAAQECWHVPRSDNDQHKTKRKPTKTLYDSKNRKS